MFGAARLTKNTDIYKLNIWNMILDLIEEDFFSVPSGGFGFIVIICGVDMSSSVDVDNKK